MLFKKYSLLGLLCLALASPAWAGLTTYSQLCPTSDPNFAPCGYGSTNASGHSNSLVWTSDVFGPDTPGPSTWEPSVDADGNPILDADGNPVLIEIPSIIPGSFLYTQSYNGSATAVALNDLWRLTMDVTLTDYKRSSYLWNWQDVADGPQAPGYYSVPTMAYVQASSTDEITIDGGTGVYSLSYVFALDGILTTTDTGLVYPSFCASLYLPGTQTASFGCKGPGDTIPTTFTLSYDDLLFGGPIIPTLSFSLSGILNPLYPSDQDPYGNPVYGQTVATNGDDTVSVNYTGQFGSTITLQKIVVTDSKGNPINNLTFKSKNGYQYNVEGATQVPFSSTVPEPASILLVLGGGAAGWLASRNRRATR
jgi:hypothetical protein